MALHLFLFALFACLSFGCFLFALFSREKIFFLASFVLMTLFAFSIQASGGIIIDQRPVSVTGSTIGYEDVTLTYEDNPTLKLFTDFLFWVGLALSVLFGIVLAAEPLSSKQSVPFQW